MDVEDWLKSVKKKLDIT
jgi:hypothetical protein